MRAGQLPWLRLIGIVWVVFFGPVAAAEAPAAPLPVCQRTPRVRDALVRATCPRCACADITPEKLATLRQLSLRRMGLTEFKPGDFSGLSSLEMLDLTGNRLKTLPDSLAVELGGLKGLKLDLALFTRLPDEVVTPLLDRPGFRWEMAHENKFCGPYQSRVSPAEPTLSSSEIEALIPFSSEYSEMELRAWTRGVLLVRAWKDDGHMDLFALSKDASQHWSLLARTEQPVDIQLQFPSMSLSAVFDLAPYRLSSSELGFGIRRTAEDIVQRLDVHEEELQVFRIHEGRIERVLKTLVYSHHDRRGPPPFMPEAVDDEYWYWKSESCSVIAVAQSKTRGVFNWVKAQSSSTTRERTAEEKQQPLFPAVVFRWTGERFEAPGDMADPILFQKD